MRATGEAPIPWERVKAGLRLILVWHELSHHADADGGTSTPQVRSASSAPHPGSARAAQRRSSTAGSHTARRRSWRVESAHRRYRIIYEITDDDLLVLVLRTGHRREIYRAR